MRRVYGFYIILFVFVLSSQMLFAQSLDRFVIGSFGESVSVSGITFSYTVGEPITTTYINQPNNFILTQGFQQPEKSDITSVETQTTQEGDFIVFPNPCTHSFSIQTALSLPFRYEIYSTDGKRIYDSRNELTYHQKMVTVNVENLSQAIYYLRILDSENHLIGNFKILKINP